MSKLPSLKGKEVVSLLKKVGFIVERQRGSHVFLKHDDGRATRDILKAYPELEEEDIVQALKYAAWLSSEKAKPIPLRGVVGA